MKPESVCELNSVSCREGPGLFESGCTLNELPGVCSRVCSRDFCLHGSKEIEQLYTNQQKGGKKWTIIRGRIACVPDLQPSFRLGRNVDKRGHVKQMSIKNTDTFVKLTHFNNGHFYNVFHHCKGLFIL